MVLGPLMLQMNVLPQVSTATTATMIVLTSSYVAIMYVVSGLVPIDYAAWFFSVAFIGALIGKSQIDKLVKKYNMTSILVFILATIIAFAVCMVSFLGVYKYSQNGFCFEGLQPICG